MKKSALRIFLISFVFLLVLTNSAIAGDRYKNPGSRTPHMKCNINATAGKKATVQRTHIRKKIVQPKKHTVKTQQVQKKRQPQQVKDAKQKAEKPQKMKISKTPDVQKKSKAPNVKHTSKGPNTSGSSGNANKKKVTRVPVYSPEQKTHKSKSRGRVHATSTSYN